MSRPKLTEREKEAKREEHKRYMRQYHLTHYKTKRPRVSQAEINATIEQLRSSGDAMSSFSYENGYKLDVMLMGEERGIKIQLSTEGELGAILLPFEKAKELANWLREKIKYKGTV